MNTSITPEQARARRRNLSDQKVAPFYTMSCDSKYAIFGDTEQHGIPTVERAASGSRNDHANVTRITQPLAGSSVGDWLAIASESGSSQTHPTP